MARLSCAYHFLSIYDWLPISRLCETQVLGVTKTANVICPLLRNFKPVICDLVWRIAGRLLQRPSSIRHIPVAKMCMTKWSVEFAQRWNNRGDQRQ
jgi:hypothetical protein